MSCLVSVLALLIRAGTTRLGKLARAVYYITGPGVAEIVVLNALA